MEGRKNVGWGFLFLGLFMAIGFFGAGVGALLLIWLGDAGFRPLVPWLLLSATLLFAVSDRIRARGPAHADRRAAARAPRAAAGAGVSRRRGDDRRDAVGGLGRAPAHRRRAGGLKPGRARGTPRAPLRCERAR